MANQFVRDLQRAARAMERFAKASQDAVPINIEMSGPPPGAPQGPTLYGPGGAPLGGAGVKASMGLNDSGGGAKGLTLAGNQSEVILALRWYLRIPYTRPDPDPSHFSAAFIAKAVAAYREYLNRAQMGGGIESVGELRQGRGGREITQARSDNPQMISGLRTNPNAQVRDTADTAGLNLASTVTAGDKVVAAAVNNVATAVNQLAKKVGTDPMGTGMRASGV